MYDNFAKNSAIIQYDQVSRDLPNLRESINNSNFVILKKDKIFDGVDVHNFNFNDIINNSS